MAMMNLQHKRLNSPDDLLPYRPPTADGPSQAQPCGELFSCCAVDAKLFVLNVASRKPGAECDGRFILRMMMDDGVNLDLEEHVCQKLVISVHCDSNQYLCLSKSWKLPTFFMRKYLNFLGEQVDALFKNIGCTTGLSR